MPPARTSSPPGRSGAGGATATATATATAGATVAVAVAGPNAGGTCPAPAAVSATEVHVPLGRRVIVLGDLLLPRTATASSRALAADVADALDRWEGPGTVVVCGNLLAGHCGGGSLTPDDVRATLEAHPELAAAIGRFTTAPERQFLVLPGWRDPEIGAEPAVATELFRTGATVTAAVDLRLATAAGERRVHVRAGLPSTAAPGAITTGAAAELRPWLSGIERLEEPSSSSRFVTSRTLYRRLGRVLWVPPLLAAVAALVVRLSPVFQGMSVLVRRPGDPRAALLQAHAASWPGRVLVTLAIVVLLEVGLALLVATLTRRFWRAHGGEAPERAGAVAGAGRGARGGAPSPVPVASAGSGLAVLAAPPAGTMPFEGLGPDAEPDHDALDEARRLVTGGATGLIAGGALRAELAHLDPGFFASPGGTTEVVREHPGRLGLPPVFLHHRQACWVELETGADLHVRLLVADADLPSSTRLERLATGYPVVNGHKPAADLHPALVASWPRGPSWPAPPDEAARQHRARRVRRLASGAIFVAGLLDLLVSVSRPAADHLHLLRQVLPLGLAQASGALVALAGVGLMLLARGVLRGQRRSRRVAAVVLAASMVLHAVHGVSLSGVLVSGVVLALLVVERDQFCAEADRPSLRSAAVTLVAGAAVAVAAASAAVEVTGHLHRQGLPPWGTVVIAVAERLAGLQTIALPDPSNDWVSPSLLGVGIALSVVVLLLATRPVVDRGLSTSVPAASPAAAVLAAEAGAGPARSGLATSTRRAAEARARDIVRRHGTGSLDYFALRDDKQWFFHRDTLVAYAVYGGTCLVSPDPIGPVSERGHAWAAFHRQCDRRGWGVAVVGAAEEWLPRYRRAGMRHVYLGDEAVVDVQRFSLDGGAMKGLRQAVNRVRRYGYEVRFLDPSAVDPATAAPLLDLMGRNRRGPAERGFSMTLGRLFDPRDAGLLLAVVVGPDGQPAALCQFVPSAAVGGYSLDLMRRDPGEHPNGILDFALCSTIEHLRQGGQGGLSLNFAALRSTLEGESGDGLAQRVERWAVRRMSGVFAIESLWRFNAKYEPSWLPRYLVVDALEQVPATLVSVMRAEALSETPVVGRFLAPTGQRGEGRRRGARPRTPVAPAP